jgi:hypothetical protein
MDDRSTAEMKNDFAEANFAILRPCVGLLDGIRTRE